MRLLPLVAEGVEKVGAVRVFAIIVRVSRTYSNVVSIKPRTLYHYFKISSFGTFSTPSATSRLPGRVAGASALPPAADIQAPKSAFAPIASASPPGADLTGGVADGPLLTQAV